MWVIKTGNLYFERGDFHYTKFIEKAQLFKTKEDATTEVREGKVALYLANNKEKQLVQGEHVVKVKLVEVNK